MERGYRVTMLRDTRRSRTVRQSRESLLASSAVSAMADLHEAKLRIEAVDPGLRVG